MSLEFGSRLDVLPPGVDLDNLTTILGETAVLHRLNLAIPPGKVTVLMGPSGVGKTTLIKHIVGLLEPAGGTVRIDGRDIWGMNKEKLREVRRGIGAMLGGHNLFATSIFSSYTVLDNLMYTLEALGVPEEERQERAMARLTEMKLLDYLEYKPAELPGHANKRLALARALVVDAPLTVLDEIDVGLDAQHSAAMLEGVLALRERTPCTVLVTTHNLALARRLADHLAIMVNGRIVAFGPPDEVLQGIETTEDFDQRFEFSDFQGPPTLEEAEASADRHEREEERKQYTFTFDTQMVIIIVVAIVLITAVFLALRMFAPGALSF